jgi:hypothetical protein
MRFRTHICNAWVMRQIHTVRAHGCSELHFRFHPASANWKLTVLPEGSSPTTIRPYQINRFEITPTIANIHWRNVEKRRMDKRATNNYSNLI